MPSATGIAKTEVMGPRRPSSCCFLVCLLRATPGPLILQPLCTCLRSRTFSNYYFDSLGNTPSAAKYDHRVHQHYSLQIATRATSSATTHTSKVHGLLPKPLPPSSTWMHPPAHSSLHGALRKVAAPVTCFAYFSSTEKPWGSGIEDGAERVSSVCSGSGRGLGRRRAIGGRGWGRRRWRKWGWVGRGMRGDVGLALRGCLRPLRWCSNCSLFASHLWSLLRLALAARIITVVFFNSSYTINY